MIDTTGNGSGFNAGVAPETSIPDEAAHVDTSSNEGDDGQQDDGADGAEDTDGQQEQFSKKAENAIKRHKRDKSRLRMELRQAREQISQLRGTKPSEGKAPDQRDFENYGDWLREDVKYSVKQEAEKASIAARETQLTQQEQALIEQRSAEISQQTAELVKDVSDLAQTVGAVMPVLDQMPAELQNMFMELDDPTLAIYVLAKEGKLQNVMAMSPHVAAAYVHAAEMRGQQFVNHMRSQKASKATNAPSPMKAARGNSQHRNEDSMTGRELLQRYKLK